MKKELKFEDIKAGMFFEIDSYEYYRSFCVLEARGSYLKIASYSNEYIDGTGERVELKIIKINKDTFSKINSIEKIIRVNSMQLFKPQYLKSNNGFREVIKQAFYSSEKEK
jgi:hypothetical protein